ncbi:phage tail tape measure protein [Lysinibacillus sp. CTST325]
MAEIGDLKVKLSLDNAQFDRSVKSMNTTLKAMGQEIRGLQNKGKEWSSSIDGLKQKQDAYSRLLEGQQTKVKKLAEEYQKAKAEQGEHADKTQKLAEQYHRATAEMTRTETELGQVTAELRKQEAELARSQSTWNKFGEAAQQAGEKMKAVGDKMTSVGKDLSMKVTAPLTALGVGAFKAAVDFESAFAGVRKTVDASEQEFDALEKGIRDMAKQMPVAATEIATVGEAAGQLGIKKENILGFSETMIKLGTATNMSSDQAATALARLANITKMNQGDFDKLGSSIVALGNNFATTESEITDMALRLAGAGAQVGMSEADILGLSAALTSVGIQAEMGGSAFSRVMVNMQMATSGTDKFKKVSDETGLTLRELQLAAGSGGKAFGTFAESMGLTRKELGDIISTQADLENFAKISGMTADQFKKAFAEDAVGAIGAFVDGLGNAEKSGTTAINMLQEMGITEIQLRDALLRAGGAAELFGDAVKTSNQGWTENNALNKEAEERYKTTASQMTILWNKIKDVGITLGDILIPKIIALMDFIAPLIEKFASLSEGTKQFILVVAGIAAAIGPLLVIGGTLISSLGAIFTAFGTVSSAIAVVTTGVAAATPAIGALASVFTVLTGPIGLTIAAVAALGIGIYAVTQELSKSSIEVEDWKNKVSEGTAQAVGSYLDLEQQTTNAFHQIAWSGETVTQEMATKMVGMYDQMGQQILTEMQSDHAAQLTEMTNFYAQSNALDETREAEILSRMKTKQAEQQAVITEGNARIKEIWETAAKEKRQISETEEKEIDAINLRMKESAVKHLSESERDQKIILDNLKTESSKISAEQAAEVVKNSEKQRKETVKNAEDTFNQTKKNAQMQRDELGIISEAEYQKIVGEAKKKRDDTIKHANDMHQNVVKEAKGQAKEHVNEVNWETGEVLSKWETFKNSATKKWGEIKTSASKKWDEIKSDTITKWEEIKAWPGKKIEEMKSAVEKKMAEVKTTIEKKWDDAKKVFKADSLLQIGKDIVNGLIKGIGDMFGGVKKKVEELASYIPDWAKDILGIHSPSRVMAEIGMWTGEGLAQGIESKSDRVSNVMKDLGNNLIDIANQYKSEEKKITEKANVEIAQIEKRSKEDIDKINRTAASKKRKTTQDENIKIQRIKEDASKKIADIEKKSAKESSDLLGKIQKDKLEKIKLFIQDKKSSEELSLKEEAEIWKQAVSQFKEGTKERVEAQKAYNKAVEDLNKADLESIKQYISDKKSSEELSLVEEAKIWERTIGLFEEGSKERIEAQQNYKKAVEAVNKEIVSINKDFQGQMKTIMDDLAKEEEQRNKTYQDTFDKRKSTLMGFAGTFDEFKVELNRTSAELMGNLQSQVDGFKEWQDQFTKLSERNIDAELLKEISDLGVKALPELSALNSMTDDQLTKYSELYREKSQLAREQTEKELVGMREDTDIQIQKLREAANDKLNLIQKEWDKAIRNLTRTTANELSTLQQIGIDAGQGLLNGLASMQGPLIDKATEIANSIKEAMQGSLDIHSPSRVMKGFGVNIAEGLIQGMNSMIAQVEQSSTGLANAVVGGQNNYDYSKQFSPNVKIYTQDSGSREMERTLRRMAYGF